MDGTRIFRLAEACSRNALVASYVRPASHVGAVSYTGTQLYDSRGSVTVQMKADSYTLVDLGFTQTVGRRFDIAFDVTNLFDELYDQSYGLPREGRAAVVTLRIRGD